MTGGSPAGIAWRYLRCNSRDRSVATIAGIAVTGVAIATAAILCVLSVFNGFKAALTDRSDLLTPDIEIRSRQGKSIHQADSILSVVSELPGVLHASPVIEEQALAIFDTHEMPVILRGVRFDEYRRITSLDSILVLGDPIPEDPLACDPPAGVISVGTASRLQLYNPGNLSGDRLFLFAPKRNGRINLANPAASFFTDSITVSAIFESQQTDFDANTVYLPIEVAEGLIQYDDQASAIILRANSVSDLPQLKRTISVTLGDAYTVRDREEMQEISFRMVNIEKWITSLLLFFILIIASFNIISTMTMVVIEKKRSLNALTAIGMPRHRIGRIFAWESFYITLVGAVAGLVLGVILCLLQEHFGFIKLEGNGNEMIMQSYPVKLIWFDILPVAAGVLLTGLFTSLIAAAFARNRSRLVK